MNDLQIKSVIAMVGLAALMAPDGADAKEYVAHAYAIESGELLYTEHHREIWVEGALVGGRVEYRDPRGAVFARKELSFARSLAAPAFRMIDDRDGFEEGASWEEEGLRLFAARGADRKVEVIEEPPAEAVIDAGFHRFMQRRLPELIAGEESEFDFAVPSYGRFVSFRVVPAGFDDRDRLRLKMKPANPLLRLLADPIELVYDRGGRLLEFRGVTNIPDESGERHLARIVFTYPEDAADAPRVAAAG